MKKGIHPKVVKAKIICACGAVYETMSTKPEIRVEVCAKCHPAYTGQLKFVDTEGRIQKFVNKYGWEIK